MNATSRTQYLKARYEGTCINVLTHDNRYHVTRPLHGNSTCRVVTRDGRIRMTIDWQDIDMAHVLHGGTVQVGRG